MTDLLTSDEIDTLLELFRAEGGGLDPQSEQVFRVANAVSEALPGERVDLLKPRGLPRGQRRVLDRLFMSVERSIAATVSDRLRLDAKCECASVERVRWSEWSARTRGPMAVFELDLAPFGSRGLATFSAELLHGAVDRLLGGSGRASANSPRFSSAEFSVADGLIEPLLRRVAEALSPLGEVGLTVIRRLGDVQLARCVGDFDPVVVVRYDIVAPPLSGDVRVVLPFADLEPHLDVSLDSDVDAAPPGSFAGRVVENLSEVPIDLEVVLGRADLTLRELLALSVGDLVRLSARVGEPVDGLIQGRRKLRGMLGPRQGRMAFQVTDSNEVDRDGES